MCQVGQDVREKWVQSMGINVGRSNMGRWSPTPQPQLFPTIQALQYYHYDGKGME